MLVDAVATVVVAAIGVMAVLLLVLAADDGEAAVNAVFLIHFTLMAASYELRAALRFFGNFVVVAAALKLARGIIRKSLD